MKYLIIAIALISTFYFLISRQPKSVKNYDGFAQCLAEKKLTMYGAYWCPHCQNQKELFGASFQYINYVDCDRNPNACSEAGIKGYPTWVINGQSYPGVQSISKLIQISGYTGQK